MHFKDVIMLRYGPDYPTLTNTLTKISSILYIDYLISLI